MASGETSPDGEPPPERASGNDRIVFERITRGVADDVTQLVLPADPRAPSAARTLLGLCIGPQLDARVLSDAQLLLSELVTNSLVHTGIGDDECIVVRIRLDDDALQLEVRNPGVTGTIASNGGDLVRGRGFGLDLVSLLSTEWGVRRDGHTAVWAELSRTAG